MLSPVALLRNATSTATETPQATIKVAAKINRNLSLELRGGGEVAGSTAVLVAWRSEDPRRP